MDNKKILQLLLVIVFAFQSCCNDDTISYELDVSEKTKSEIAKQNVLDFIGQMETQTRSGICRTIESVEPYVMSETRGSLGSTQDTLFYVVNFSNNNGFAIATADEKGSGVIAFVESGNFNDALNDSVSFLNAYLGNYVASMEKEDDRHHGEDRMVPVQRPDDEIGGGGGGGSSRPADKFEILKPILVTKWGQSPQPFNNFTPNHYPSGCVMTAISQICSYLETPNQISYNSIGKINLDWNKIKSESKKWSGDSTSAFSPEIGNQIGHLIRFWGVAFNAKYGSDETTASLEDAVGIMRKNFNFDVTGVSDYNVNNVIRDLKTGNKIVVMSGYDHYRHVWFFAKKYYSAHVWVVDGYIDQIKNGVDTKYIHCNWGWCGFLNGYFQSDYLNADDGVRFDDNGNSFSYKADLGRQINFRVKLETATFTKK